jgi:tetratricopeptide (TPR) repeat protein
MKNVMHHVGRALAAWHRGRNHEAIREFRKAAKTRPRQVELWVVLGDLEQEEELYAAAVRSYGRALDLMASGRGLRYPSLDGRTGPTEATTRRSLGAVLGQSGQLAEAEIEFRRSIELRPDPVSWIALGEVLELTGRVREARAAFLQARRLDRRSVEALYRLGSLHMWTAPERAERIMRRVIGRDEAHPLALAALGLLLGMRGAFDEADTMLRRAARTGRAGALPHVYRGHHLLHQGRTEEAVAAYGEALEAAPGDPHPFFAIGDLHRQEGRDEKAREAYRDALRLDPRCGDAALRLGYLEEDEGHAAEALHYYRRGLELAPQHPWADDVRQAIRRLTA